MIQMYFSIALIGNKFCIIAGLGRKHNSYRLRDAYS